MSWQEYYNSRIITADDAIKLLKKGDLVINGHGTGEPQLLPEALVRNQDSVEGIVVAHGIALGPSVYCGEDVDPKHVEHLTVFAGTHTRKAIKEQRARFVPMHFSDCPIAMRNGIIKVDVAWTQVSPPDKHGFCTFGISCDYERAAVETARLVVAEVNPNMPRTFGDTHVHISEVDYFVEHHQIPPTLPSPQPDEEAMKIGEHVAKLVEDGATIQLGIGEIPNAVALSLKGKKDLGVHTEMMVDSVMELYEQGVITNKKKALHKGKFICTFAMGSEKLYRWLDNNPSVEFLKGSYVNDPCVIRKNSKMVSLNTCIMIDFTGQVASESIGIEQYSGTGGQTDTAEGAVEGFDGLGKSIIACRSTAKRGQISTIVPVLPEGTGVTLHRSHTDYVVTEWGHARLTGLTVRERTKVLISIAHPKFRDELTAKAKQMGYLY